MVPVCFEILAKKTIKVQYVYSFPGTTLPLQQHISGSQLRNNIATYHIPNSVIFVAGHTASVWASKFLVHYICSVYLASLETSKVRTLRTLSLAIIAVCATSWSCISWNQILKKWTFEHFNFELISFCSLLFLLFFLLCFQVCSWHPCGSYPVTFA